MLIAGLLLGAFFLLSGPGRPGGGSPAQAETVGRVADEGTDIEALASPGERSEGAAEAGPRAIGTISVGTSPERASMTKSFEGSGVLAGLVRTEGAPMPETWTVRIEPSIFGIGRQSATTKVIEAEPGQLDFEVRDLPLGGYRVHAFAPGMRSRSVEVTLYKLEGIEYPADPRMHVDLILRPKASIDGTVRQASGDVADALPVFLVSRTPQSGDGGKPGDDAAAPIILSTVTDAAGIYRFAHVDAGAWLVMVGDPVRSLCAPVPISIETAVVQLDEVVLPPWRPSTSPFSTSTRARSLTLS